MFCCKRQYHITKPIPLAFQKYFVKINRFRCGTQRVYPISGGLLVREDSGERKGRSLLAMSSHKNRINLPQKRFYGYEQFFDIFFYFTKSELTETLAFLHEKH